MEPNPAPDPNPRQPRLELPIDACDCHAHVFGPRDRYPLRANPGYAPAPAPFPQYLRMLRTIGCSRAVLVQPSPYGIDHSALLDALRSHEFPLRGISLYDDALSDDDLVQLHHFGVQGTRIHIPATEAATILPRLTRIAARVRPFGWHLQFFLDAENSPDIDRALADLPVPIVIDHFGRVPAAGGLTSRGFETLRRLAGNPRCWFKLSAPYRVSDRPPHFPDAAALARALVAAAPDRCVWGTDWPHPNAAFMPNDGDLVDLLADWIPNPAARRKVLVDNPVALYGF